MQLIKRALIQLSPLEVLVINHLGAARAGAFEGWNLESMYRTQIRDITGEFGGVRSLALSLTHRLGEQQTEQGRRHIAT